MTWRLRQQVIEPIDRAFPKSLVTRNPSARLFELPLAQPEPMDAPFDGALDETGPLEDLQVSRNGGLRGAEPAAQLAGAAGLASRERMDHRAAGAVGQGAKDAIQAGKMSHSHVTIRFSPRPRKRQKVTTAGSLARSSRAAKCISSSVRASRQ